MNDQCLHYIETCQLIFSLNQLNRSLMGLTFLVILLLTTFTLKLFHNPSCEKGIKNSKVART